MPTVKARANEHEGAKDGRALRSERSQMAIVDAMTALVAEHSTELTYETIAARAHVSVRTVFRHFSDTDALYEALYERFGIAAIRIGTDWVRVGSLAGDLAALIDARVRMYVYVEPLRRFARTARPPPPSVQDRFGETKRKARANLRSVFDAHGESVAPDELEALEAWLSLDVWERLHKEQGLSRARALRVLHATARVLARIGERSAR